jgi:hypothetical protein
VSVRCTVSLAVTAVALAVAGCGSTIGHHAPAAKRASAKTLPTPCAAQAQTALAAALHTSRQAISPRPFTPPSGAAACRFKAPGLDVVATLDSAPQVYYRFERTTVEYYQNVIWAHLGEEALPIDIHHLGLDADWIPPRRQIITTDGVRLITVTVTTLPTYAHRLEPVAARLARAYLGPLHDPFRS